MIQKMLDNPHKIIKTISILLILVVTYFILGWVRFLAHPLSISEVVTHTVIPGETLSHTTIQLTDKNWLSSPNYLLGLAMLRGDANNIQAGEYELTPGISANQLLDKLVHGKVKQYPITLVEGWDLATTLKAIRNDRCLTHTLDNTPIDQIAASMQVAEKNLEGLLFPDTYYCRKGMTDKEFLLRAYRAMQQHLQKLWANRPAGLPYKTAYEALTMASIVEKEAQLDVERPKIAGVFIRRLKEGMRLDSDPTVKYGLGELPSGRLTKKHLALDTPYNTYQNKRLPPTPIALPGLKSLQAAFYPTEETALYFVAKGDGSHHFSGSLAEHNRAVKQYRQ